MQLGKMICVIRYNQMFDRINFFEYNKPLSFASKIKNRIQKIEFSKPVHAAKISEDREINSIFSLGVRMSVGEKETRRAACGATSWRLCSHPQQTPDLFPVHFQEHQNHRS